MKLINRVTIRLRNPWYWLWITYAVIFIIPWFVLAAAFLVVWLPLHIILREEISEAIRVVTQFPARLIVTPGRWLFDRMGEYARETHWFYYDIVQGYVFNPTQPGSEAEAKAKMAADKSQLSAARAADWLFVQ